MTAWERVRGSGREIPGLRRQDRLIAAPGRPETGTKDRTSRAMNILRCLLPFV